MPTAVTHLLVPLFIVALFRDYYLTKHDRKRFPLHYVLIAGIGGVLPDIDILAYLVLHYAGFAFEQVHRTLLHSLIIPASFALLSLATRPLKNKTLGRHKLTIHGILLALAFGTLMHVVLDGTIIGDVHPFAPFSNVEVGLNLISFLPDHIKSIAIPLFEGILLLLWIIYLELKHKISDFI